MANRALVTGGAGFIGSYLCQRLIRDGWWVSVVDDLSTGSRANVAPLLDHPRFRLVVGSAADREVMEPHAASANVIFHLAAAVGVRLVVEDPGRTIRTNTATTEAVVELASEHGCQVIFTSSSEVYGKGAGGVLTESADVVLGPSTSPRWCYAASKLLDEFRILAHGEASGLPVTIFRLFNTVGPRQTGRYGMVVPNFVSAALAERPLQVHGDGLQRRSFTWVEDTIGALVSAVGRPETHGEVINLGHFKDIGIRELAELVVARLESRSEIESVPYAEVYGGRFEDIRSRRPDLTKAAALLDYRPTLDLGEIVDRVAAAMREPALRTAKSA